MGDDDDSGMNRKSLLMPSNLHSKRSRADFESSNNCN